VAPCGLSPNLPPIQPHHSPGHLLVRPTSVKQYKYLAAHEA
jgi:hypothetical protein